MINWINSWRLGNKKNKIDICLRIGIFTIFELYVCLDKACKPKKKNKKRCDKCTTFRLMVLNLGIEI
jgi:hypothetical protein